MPLSDPLDDPVRNAGVGCLWPVLRNFLSVGAVFILAAIVAVRSGNSNWFFIIMFGCIPLYWILDKTLFAERNRRERAAQKRFFGLKE